MRFVKFHGYGNDYLVFEAAELKGVGLSPGFERVGAGEPFFEFVKKVCDRHFGAGSDGIAVVEPLDDEADFRLRIFNPDGGEAAMSGNGSRCAAAYLHHEGLWAEEELRFDTRAGVKHYRLRGRPSPGSYRFEAEIGRPRFASASIPMLTSEPLAEVRDYPLALAEGETMQ